MHYPTLTNATLSLPVWIGNISGCLFSLWWLQRVMRMSYIRPGIIGSAARLSRDDVPHDITLDKHMSSLRSALLPWLCLHDTEHSVHGLSP